MNASDTIAGRLGRFVADLRIEDVPPDVVEKARACLLFAYGIGIGSNHLPYAPVARRAAFEMDGEIPGGATVFGDGARTSASGAVLANAALFHGRNQEDTCGSTHAGVVVVPVLTALLEARRMSTERMLPALIAGYEVACTLDHALAAKTTPAGFRATPIYGAIGAAAAAAKLLDLPAQTVSAAISNATGCIGATLQSQASGTDEWRYQVGVAGHVGIVAAQLARAGSVSAPLAIEGRAGFAKALARSQCDVGAVTGALGREWQLRDVAFKPYPLPAWNQTPVALAEMVRDRVGGRTLRRVRVRMHPYEVAYPGKDAKGPFNSETEAKLSISFSVATALAHGTPTFALLQDFRNTRTNEILAQIEIEADPAIARLSCRMTIELAGGEIVDQSLQRSWRDYSFDCRQVGSLVRAVGRETGVPHEAYDRLESFVACLPSAAIDEVVQAFALMPAGGLVA